MLYTNYVLYYYYNAFIITYANSFVQNFQYALGVCVVSSWREWCRGEGRKINTARNHFTLGTKIDLNEEINEIREATTNILLSATFEWRVRIYTFNGRGNLRLLSVRPRLTDDLLPERFGWIFFHLPATRNGQRAIKFRPYTSICHPDDTAIV